MYNPTTSAPTPQPSNPAQVDHSDELGRLLEIQRQTFKTLINKQWLMVVTAVLLAFLALVVVACLAFYNMERQPRALVGEIRQAQGILVKALEATPSVPVGAPGGSVSSAPAAGATASADVLAAAKKLVEVQQNALDKLADIEAKPSASSASVVQFVGSAAVITLLGLLGLQRLQNFDAEISSLRNSVDARIDGRAKELREDVAQAKGTVPATVRTSVDEALRASLDERLGKIREELGEAIEFEVEKQFQSADQKLRGFQTDAEDLKSTLSKELKAESERAQESVAEGVQQAQAVSAKIEALINQYPWLGDRNATDVIAKIAELASVDEAHDLATLLEQKGDRRSARAALKVIIDKKLSGTSEDYHNACSQAMRMETPQLGLDLAEAGLEYFPNQADLVADKMLAMHNLGKSEEARAYFADWRKTNPTDVKNAWRAVMFYGSIVRGAALDEAQIDEVSKSLEEATLAMPQKPKVWGARIEFETRNGRHAEAEAVAREAVVHNPFSQQLHMQWGEILLTLGRAKEAREALTKAVQCDFQDQFQHDVNQFAVVCSLAQAHEACGDGAAAVPLYQHVLAGSDSHFLKRYAENRLKALRLLGAPGAGEAQASLEQEKMQKLNFLSEMLRRHGGEPPTVDDD